METEEAVASSPVADVMNTNNYVITLLQPVGHAYTQHCCNNGDTYVRMLPKERRVFRKGKKQQKYDYDDLSLIEQTFNNL